MSAEDPNEVRELLFLYPDGELSEEEERRVRSYLENHPEAERLVEEVNALRDRLRELPSPPAPAHFGDRVLAKHADEQASQPFRSFRRSMTVFLSAAAAVIIGVAFFGFGGFGGDAAAPNESVVAESPSGGLARPDGEAGFVEGGEPRELDHGERGAESEPPGLVAEEASIDVEMVEGARKGDLTFTDGATVGRAKGSGGVLGEDAIVEQVLEEGATFYGEADVLADAAVESGEAGIHDKFKEGGRVAEDAGGSTEIRGEQQTLSERIVGRSSTAGPIGGVPVPGGAAGRSSSVAPGASAGVRGGGAPSRIDGPIGDGEAQTDGLASAGTPLVATENWAEIWRWAANGALGSQRSPDAPEGSSSTEASELAEFLPGSSKLIGHVRFVQPYAVVAEGVGEQPKKIAWFVAGRRLVNEADQPQDRVFSGSQVRPVEMVYFGGAVDGERESVEPAGDRRVESWLRRPEEGALDRGSADEGPTGSGEAHPAAGYEILVVDLRREELSELERRLASVGEWTEMGAPLSAVGEGPVAHEAGPEGDQDAAVVGGGGGRRGRGQIEESAKLRTRGAVESTGGHTGELEKAGAVAGRGGTGADTLGKRAGGFRGREAAVEKATEARVGQTGSATFAKQAEVESEWVRVVLLRASRASPPTGDVDPPTSPGDASDR